MRKYAFICLMIVLFGALASFMVHPTVSVVMPVYNRETLVERAILSVLEQSFKDFEFIIVDDGSTDSTPDILQKYARKDKRVRVLTNDTNRGISYSRNRGNDAARGKYIAVMDSDDIATPNRLLKTVRFLDTHPDITAVSGNVEDIKRMKQLAKQLPDKSVEPIIVRTPARYQIELMFYNEFQHVTSLVRRDFLQKHNLKYDPSFAAAEDYAFWWNIVKNGGKLVRLSETFAFVRFHRTNSSAYYQTMAQNAAAVRYEQISRLTDISQEELTLNQDLFDKCQLFRKIETANENKRLFHPAELAAFGKQFCPPKNTENAYPLVHPLWTAWLYEFEPGRYQLSTKQSLASIEIKKEQMIVHWDEWPRERFVFKNNRWRYVPEGARFTLVYPDHKEIFTRDAKELYGCVTQNDRCASFRLTKEDNELAIAWNKGDVDLFKKTAPNTYQFKSSRER